MNPRHFRGQQWRWAASLALFFVVASLQLFTVAPTAAQAVIDENGDPVYYDHYGNPLYGYHGERVYYYDSDAESCPRRIVLAFNGQMYTASPYAGYANRGADAYLGKVFYTFSNIPSLDRKWTASGNVYLYGWECRLSTYVNPSGALLPPYSRLEYTESPASVACTGGTSGGIGDPGVVVDVAYDPYASGGECGGGDPGDGGSGTPYNPGDNTGGETVDWGSGVGNGGGSVCGAAAVVEYVCIDVWYEGVGWVEWSCGYVTTC